MSRGMRVISTALISMPAPSAIQSQESPMTMTSAATTTARSRRNTASSTDGAASVIAARRPSLRPAVFLFVLVVGMDQPVRTPGDVGERAVPAAEIELYRPHTLGSAGRVFGFVEHPAVRQHRDHAMLLVGHRITDRFAACPDDARHLDARGALGQVPVEGDRRKLRVFDGPHHDTQ